MTDQKPTAYPYIRLSKKTQAEGSGEDRQAENAKAWCEKNGYKYDEKFVMRDIGFSAYKGDNITEGELSKFIAKLGTKIRPGSLLIIEHIDRLSRQKPLITIGLIGQILDAGVNILVLNDNKIITSDNINDIPQLLGVVLSASSSHEESDKKSRRCREAWKALREKQRDNKVITPIVPGWLVANKKNNTITAIPQHAATIKEIFKLAQRMGAQNIAQQLNKDRTPVFTGITARKKYKSGKPIMRTWTKSYIASILKNRAVLGEYEQRERDLETGAITKILLTGHYPPIITDIEFARAQKAIEKRKGSGGPQLGKPKNIFTGIARCAECISPMHYKNKGTSNGGAGIYLTCSGHDKGICDENRHWRYDEVEKIVLIELAQSIDWFSGIAGTTQNEIDDQIGAVNAKIATLKLAVNQYKSLIGDASKTALFDAIRPDFERAATELSEAQRELKKLEIERNAGLGSERALNALTTILARLEREKDPDELFRLKSEINAALRSFLKAIIFSGSKTAISAIAKNGERHHLVLGEEMYKAVRAIKSLTVFDAKVEDILARQDEEDRRKNEAARRARKTKQKGV